jgi:small GTP-binding protein
VEKRSRTLKIILMGPAAVGKTSIRERYLGKGFRTTHHMTIGADFALKKVKKNDQEFIIQIWDLSGQPAFYEVRKLYYRGTDGMFIIFDLSRMTTLDEIPNWIAEYNKNSETMRPAILIGNKVDLVDDSVDSLSETIMKKIQQLDINDFIESQHIFTSALTGENIDRAFDLLIDRIVEEESPNS